VRVAHHQVEQDGDRADDEGLRLGLCDCV
jgi:hypothetical protein